MPGDCVDVATWRRFAVGQVAEPALSGLAAHLDDCDACRDRLRAAGPADPLLAHLRRLACADDDASTLEPPPPAPGTRLGRFDLLEVLGQGSFGRVFRARDRDLDREVALKVPRGRPGLAADLAARVIAEARAAARLNHPHVLQVHDCHLCDGTFVIASELCTGPSLADWLAAGGRPTPREGARLALAIARAAACAHAHGLLHRDIKPGNILLQPTDSGGILEVDGGAGLVPKLCDFGLATAFAPETGGADARDGSRRPVGTPAYMPPEVVAFGDDAATVAGDVYAIGVVLHRLLTGVVPVEGTAAADPLRRLDPELRPGPVAGAAARAVPTDLLAVCAKAVAPSPSRRYRTAAELAGDLERFLDGRAVAARPRGPVGTAVGWARRHPSWAALAATLTAGLLVTLVGLVVHQRRISAARARAEAGEAVARAHIYAAQVRLAGLAHDACDHDLAGLHLATAARHLAGATPCFEWRYLRGRLADIRPDAAAVAHAGGVTTLAFSPTGDRLASAGRDGRVRVWSVPALEPLREWQAHTGDVNRLAWSADGTRVATGSDDGGVGLWRVDDGAAIGAWHREGRVFEVVFLPNGDLCFGGDRGGVEALDPTSGTTRWRVPARDARGLAVAPRGSLVAVADADHGLRLCDTATGSAIRTAVGSPAVRINDVAFTPDGTGIIAASRDGAAMCWNVGDGAVRHRLVGHIDAVHAVQPLADSRHVLTASVDRSLGIWDADRLLVRFRPGGEPMWALAAAPAGLVAGGDRGGTIHLWRWSRLAPRRQTRVVEPTGEPLGRFAAPVAGDRLALTSATGAFAVTGFDDAVLRREAGTACDAAEVFDLGGSPALDLVVAAGRTGRLTGWTASSGARQFGQATDQGRIFAFGFLPRQACFVTAGEDGAVVARGLATGGPLRELWRHDDLALCLAVAPDGVRLASGGEDRRIIVGPAGTGGGAERRLDSGQVVSALCWIDEERLAVGDHDGRVVVWDVVRRHVTATLPGATDRVLALACAPDGATLVAGCRGGRVLCWNLATEQLTLVIDDGRGGLVRDAWFTAGGAGLVTARIDGAGHPFVARHPAPP